MFKSMGGHVLHIFILLAFLEFNFISGMLTRKLSMASKIAKNTLTRSSSRRSNSSISRAKGRLESYLQKIGISPEEAPLLDLESVLDDKADGYAKELVQHELNRKFPDKYTAREEWIRNALHVVMAFNDVLHEIYPHILKEFIEKSKELVEQEALKPTFKKENHRTLKLPFGKGKESLTQQSEKYGEFQQRYNEIKLRVSNLQTSLNEINSDKEYIKLAEKGKVTVIDWYEEVELNLSGTRKQTEYRQQFLERFSANNQKYLRRAKQLEAFFMKRRIEGIMDTDEDNDPVDAHIGGHHFDTSSASSTASGPISNAIHAIASSSAGPLKQAPLSMVPSTNLSPLLMTQIMQTSNPTLNTNLQPSAPPYADAKVKEHLQQQHQSPPLLRQSMSAKYKDALPQSLMASLSSPAGHHHQQKSLNNFDTKPSLTASLKSESLSSQLKLTNIDGVEQRHQQQQQPENVVQPATHQKPPRVSMTQEYETTKSLTSQIDNHKLQPESGSNQKPPRVSLTQKYGATKSLTSQIDSIQEDENGLNKLGASPKVSLGQQFGTAAKSMTSQLGQENQQQQLVDSQNSRQSARVSLTQQYGVVEPAACHLHAAVKKQSMSSQLGGRHRESLSQQFDGNEQGAGVNKSMTSTLGLGKTPIARSSLHQQHLLDQANQILLQSSTESQSQGDFYDEKEDIEAAQHNPHIRKWMDTHSISELDPLNDAPYQQIMPSRQTSMTSQYGNVQPVDSASNKTASMTSKLNQEQLQNVHGNMGSKREPISSKYGPHIPTLPSVNASLTKNLETASSHKSAVTFTQQYGQTASAGGRSRLQSLSSQYEIGGGGQQQQQTPSVEMATIRNIQPDLPVDGIVEELEFSSKDNPQTVFDAGIENVHYEKSAEEAVDNYDVNLTALDTHEEGENNKPEWKIPENAIKQYNDQMIVCKMPNGTIWEVLSNGKIYFYNADDVHDLTEFFKPIIF